MFRTYSELLNSLDCAATTKLTICNRRQSQADFEQSILMPMREDRLDKYRREYNQMLMDKATAGADPAAVTAAIRQAAAAAPVWLQDLLISLALEV